MTINERIEFLEQTVNILSAQLKAISANTEGATKPPYSVVGASKDPNIDRPIIWNNTEINASYGTQPATPKSGYNKHSHSRFSGGALVYGVVEVVDYDWGIITNKNSQSYLEELPIIKEKNSLGQSVNRVGQLDLIFNPDTLTWGCPAYEIDVKKCFLVERDENGAIALDGRLQEKKSPLYNSDTNKTSIVWDEMGGCWRLYCVYAPSPTP